MHYVSTADILKLWESHGIHSDRKGVYRDIKLLVELGYDIVCVKSTQNRYFIASRCLNCLNSGCWQTRRRHPNP